MSEAKLYGDRDIEALGQFYADHVMAMTAEGLHEKSDIAAELAHRDAEIATLRATVGSFESAIEAHNAKLAAVPTFARPATAEEGLRNLPAWFQAFYPDAEDRSVEEDLREWAARIATLEAAFAGTADNLDRVATILGGLDCPEGAREIRKASSKIRALVAATPSDTGADITDATRWIEQLREWAADGGVADLSDGDCDELAKLIERLAEARR